ncbi:MAG: hypothetical protein ACRD1U_10425, partial [Vicinamibacterales bacterium]
PYPIASDQSAGAYKVSIWADPDATDDGTPGGQFWVTIQTADGGALPPDTRARITIAPSDRGRPSLSADAEPIENDIGRQFVALLMDHEGPFSVQTTITGSLGTAVIDSAVDATYDLRPPPAMLALYLAPFVLVGVLWLKLLLKRRTLPNEAMDDR